MSGKKGRFLFTILLVLIVFGLGTKIVNAKEDSETDILQDEIQDALLTSSRNSLEHMSLPLQ